MNVQAYLAELRARDVRVWADGDHLRCSGPPDALTPAVRDGLRDRKTDILAYLRSAASLATRFRAIVPLQPQGTRPPIFGVPGHNGDVFCYLSLAAHIGSEQPLYGLQPPGLDGRDAPLRHIEDLAAYFAAQIRAFHPAGPCIIAGFCAGGMTAFELGRLMMLDRPNVVVALIGAPYVSRYRLRPILADGARRYVTGLTERAHAHTRALAPLPWRQRGQYIADRVRRAYRNASVHVPPDPVLALRAGVERATLAGARRYEPAALPGPAVLLLPNAAWARSGDEPLRWRDHAAESEVHRGPADCTRDTLLREPYVGAFARMLSECAERCVAVALPAPHGLPLQQASAGGRPR